MHQPPVRSHGVGEHTQEMAYWLHSQPFLISVVHQLHFCELCVCLTGFTVNHVYTILECSALISLFISSTWKVFCHSKLILFKKLNNFKSLMLL